MRFNFRSFLNRFGLFREKPERAIEPGQEHFLNKPPHRAVSPDARMSSNAIKPVLLKLRNGRSVRVYPMNGSWVKLDSGYFSKLLLDEYSEPGKPFENIVKGVRKGLIKSLNEEHGLHPDRFN